MRPHIWFVLWCVVYYCASKAEKLRANCIGCKEVDSADQRDVNDYLRMQKIANRLEYIKRQMANNLYANDGSATTSSGPPEPNHLPEFLIEQLTNNNRRQDISWREEESAKSKRVVLFPKESK